MPDSPDKIQQDAIATLRGALPGISSYSVAGSHSATLADPQAMLDVEARLRRRRLLANGTEAVTNVVDLSSEAGGVVNDVPTP